MEESGNYSDQEKALEYVKSLIRPFPDFPSPGIIFRDICPVLKDCNALRIVTDLLTDHLRKNFQKIDAIVGLDARGFLFGPLVSMSLNVPFLLVRNARFKDKISLKDDVLEMQADAIHKGQKVVVLDDDLATGSGKTANVGNEFRKYRLDILRLSEMRSVDWVWGTEEQYR
ncbi:hypothetical protein ACROYT_G012028 [Oculina patagonica]